MKLKKVLTKVTALLCAVAAIAAFPSTSVSAASAFESAAAASENIAVGWNLGNSLDSCGEWIGMYT
ncbi:MAG: hypothetical protein ACI4RK_01995, partial [Oscillospiraceae bacterium]